MKIPKNLISRSTWAACAVMLALIAFSALRQHAKAQSLATGVTITLRSYYCDPATVVPCPAVNKQVVYTSPNSEQIKRFQDLMVPGQPLFVKEAPKIQRGLRHSLGIIYMSTVSQ